MNAERKAGPRQPVSFGNNSGNPREIRNGVLAPLSIEEMIMQSMGKSLGEVWGEDRFVARAIIVIDEMHLPLTLIDRKSIFAYALWDIEGGDLNLVAKYSGESTPTGINSLIDPVIEREYLSTEYDRVYQAIDVSSAIDLRRNDLGYYRRIASSVIALLNQGLSDAQILAIREEIIKRVKVENEEARREAILGREHYSEVFNMKNKKTPHKAIAEALGIPLTRIHGISKDLITAGLIKPSSKGRFRAAAFAEFCDSVLRLRKQGIIDYDEVARRLGVSRGSVDRAIGRLSSSGRLKVFTKKELGAIKSRKKKDFREKVKSYRNHTNLSVEEIAVATKSTREQVRIQILKLIRSGEILSRQAQDRKRKKEELRRILRSGLYRSPKSKINLKAAMKKLGTSFYTTRSLYDEIAQEEPVLPRIIQVHKSSLANPR